MLKNKEGVHKPKKLNKLVPRAFIGFLVGYNSVNIYRVWNPVKNKGKSYRDVIFNKYVTYYSFIKDNVIKEKKKVE